MNRNNTLLRKLRRGTYHANGDDMADLVVSDIVAPAQTTDSGLVKLGPGKYNPQFKANISVDFVTLYFTESGGTYTQIAASALAATLKTSLPFFIFGNDDFESGYAQLRDANPVQIWSYNSPIIYGRDFPFDAFGQWDSTVTALLQTGDVIIPFTATVSGTNYVALKVVRSSTVKYASLLNATQSNTFVINLIRYAVPDTTATSLAQYTNSIQLFNLSMFGAKQSDKIEPLNFRNPEQQLANITDIDTEMLNINKQKAIAVMGNYDVVSFQWSVFVQSANKIL